MSETAPVNDSASGRRSILAHVFHLIDESRGAKQNAAIDGLRGLSVALVFFVHLPLWLAPWLAIGTVENVGMHIMGVGQTGVDVFFALSGYLIYGGLIAREQKYGAFLTRRLQRLYPLYLVAIIAVMFIRTAGTGSADWLSATGNPLVLLVMNLLMVPDWAGQPPIYGVTWTLTWEWQFYLLMPLIVNPFPYLGRWLTILRTRHAGSLIGFARLLGYLSLFNMRQRSRTVRVGILLALWTVQAAVASFGDRGIIRYAAFGAGSIAAEWVGARNERRAAGEEVRSLRVAGIVASIATAAVVLFGSLSGVPHRKIEDGQIKLDLSWDHRIGQEIGFRWAFLFLIPIVIVAAIDEREGIHRFLQSIWLRRLGVVSYSFYLVHYMVTRISLEMLAKVLVPGEVSNVVAILVGSVMAIVLTLIATLVAFVLVERPLSLAKDPFITVIPPKLVRRPTRNDFLPGWSSRRAAVPPSDAASEQVAQ